MCYYFELIRVWVGDCFVVSFCFCLAVFDLLVGLLCAIIGFVVGCFACVLLLVGLLL